MFVCLLVDWLVRSFVRSNVQHLYRISLLISEFKVKIAVLKNLPQVILDGYLHQKIGNPTDIGLSEIILARPHEV